MKAPHTPIPAFSAESEASVLGALMLDNNSIYRVPDLSAESFYIGFNSDVFCAIQALAVAGKPFDVITVYEQLQRVGKAERGDELSRLGEIAQYVPSAANLRRYAEILGEKLQSRALAKAAVEISELATSAGNPAQQIDAAQMILAKLATVKTKRDPQHINQSLADYLSLLTDLSDGKNPAIPTGISGLDRILNGGIRRGEMMVLGARPKHGKTAIALALARNMAREYAVLFISQEMPVMQLMHRHTAAMGSVDLGRILRADASDSGMWERVTDAAEKLGRLHLVHDDQSAQSLMDIRRKAMQVKRQHGLDVLFVDFLQLMQGANGSEENRNRELDVIVNGIKALAMDLQIGIVVLSQMSRKADEDYGRPAMTHLRDSGSIEAAADQVALLFTDHAHPKSKKEPAFKCFAELEIVAHRNGPTGIVPLHIEGAMQQIADWDQPLPSRLRPVESRGIRA
jgi:replicative DNA helicase